MDRHGVRHAKSMLREIVGTLPAAPVTPKLVHALPMHLDYLLFDATDDVLLYGLVAQTPISVLIIEDVVTSGISIAQTGENLRKSGLKADTAIVFLNREQVHPAHRTRWAKCAGRNRKPPQAGL